MDETLELSAEDLGDVHDDLRGIRVACSGATDNLRSLLDTIPAGSGCVITIVGVDGEDEGDEDAEWWRGVDEFFGTTEASPRQR